MGIMCRQRPHCKQLAVKGAHLRASGGVRGQAKKNHLQGVNFTWKGPREPPEAPGFKRFKSPKNLLQGVNFTYNFRISVISILVVSWSCYLTRSSVPPNGSFPPTYLKKGGCSPPLHMPVTSVQSTDVIMCASHRYIREILDLVYCPKFLATQIEDLQMQI